MKISVIVPVYNAEKYIDKCISSVFEQTYTKWELILVDDGSVDRSSSIIDKFAKQDDRIVAIHQKNAGPGMARNRGIKEATGDYIVFLDSDDYLDKEYFELLLPKAAINDVVFIDVCQVNINGKKIKKEKMSDYITWNKDRIVRAQMTGKIPWGGVRKAVRLEYLKENEIRFAKCDIGEEALYSFQVIDQAKSIGFLDEKIVYYYVNHENSQSKMQIIDPWKKVFQILKEYMIKNSRYEEYANTLNALNVTATVISLDKIQHICRAEEKKSFAKARMLQFEKSYDKNQGIDLRSMSYKAKVFVPFIVKGQYWPIFLCSKLKR